MKTLFLEAKSPKKIKLTAAAIKKLPPIVCLATTIQYIDNLTGIKKQIEATGKKIKLFKGQKTKYPGQILGCEINNAENSDYLYIGDGKFHPIALKLKSGKKVYTYNPYSRKLDHVGDVSKWQKKQKGALLKYYTSKNVGIIVTTKKGQRKMKQALKLASKKDAEKSKISGTPTQGKSYYIFECDTLDFNQLENFPFIEVWINTMCPRIAYDDAEKFNKPVINISAIPD